MAKRPRRASVYALRFISGRYQGGAYPLRPGRDVVIGRQGGLDLVLAEELVSRRHAKVRVRNGEVHIQDLGSTNGTFVNGARVKKAKLSRGDRILIGGSILKLVLARPASETKTRLQVLAGLEAAEARQAREPAGMRGRLEDVPLPDLVQLLTTGKKNGRLSIRDGNREASLFLHDGRVVQCQLGGRPEFGSRKSFFRLLAWDRGDFELSPSAGETVEDQVEESSEALLLEGLRQLDEWRRLEPSLPPRLARLGVPTPLEPRLRALDPEELDVFQLALAGTPVQEILDGAAGTDLEAGKVLLGLIEKGYLRQL